jgi:hypothetical protein
LDRIGRAEIVGGGMKVLRTLGIAKLSRIRSSPIACFRLFR